MKRRRALVHRALLPALLAAVMPPAAAQQAPAAKPIVLGTTAAFSGPFAEYGQEYRKGADACLAPVNAAGGVHGRPVRIEYLDDAYDAARTVKNARELAARGVSGFVNLVGTGPMLALMPVLEELKVPVFGMSSGAEQVRTERPGSRWLFHTKASYGDEFQGFARVLPTIGMTRLALVYQDNAFGKAGLESAKASFAEVGLAADIPPILLRAGPEGVAQAVADLQKARPHAAVLVVAGAAAPQLIAAYQQAAGPAARVAVLSVVGGRVLTDELKATVRGIMTSLVYPSPWSGGRRVAREYQAAMAAAGQPLSLLSLEGCVNLRFAVKALEAAGNDLSGPGVRRALEQRGVVLDLGDYALRLRPGAQVASTYTSLGIYRPNGQVME